MILMLTILMPRFQSYNYEQHIMLVINLEEQLQPGTFEHALHYLIEHKIDLSAFHGKYLNDETGRPAYDPALLLKVVLFAYYKGITSSREIEWCCLTNTVFKALSCDLVPHFTTIAEFVSSSGAAILSVFEQVLLVCDQQGLLGHELLAMDGCKMSSNAAKEWSGKLSELETKRQKIRRQVEHHLAAHREADALNQFDQVARHQQAIDTLEKASNRIEKFLADAKPRMGEGSRPKEVQSNITDNESAKMRTSKGTIQGYNGIATVDKKYQIVVDASAFGSGPEQHALPLVLARIQARYARLKIKENILAEAIITADTGFASEANIAYLHDAGIDAYVPDNQFRQRDPRFADKVKKHPNRVRQDRPLNSKLNASEFQFDPVAQTCVCPAGKSLLFHHQTDERVFFQGRLTDCRHCPRKFDCMRNPESADHRKGHGRQVSFASGKKQTAIYTEWMKHRVDSAFGKQVYGHRMSVVEPVFGNLEHNKGLTKFSLRGRDKVNGQWQLHCLVQNIEKLSNYGNLAA